MKSFFPVWIALAILGCRSDNKTTGSCVKTHIETLSAEESLVVKDKSAFGGYAIFRESGGEKGAQEKVCTQTLMTNFEKLAQGEIGTFVTSRHCLDWFLVDHNTAEIVILDPSPDLNDHRIGIELVNNPLEALSKFKHLRNTAGGKEVAHLISNLAFDSCLAGQYALQFKKGQQSNQLDNYYKHYILQDESIVLEEEKNKTALSIFDGVPCYSYLDAQLIKFKVKQEELVKLKYLASRFQDSSQDFDFTIIEERETEWLKMAVKVLGYLTYRDSNEDHIDKFETAVKSFANYAAFRDAQLYRKEALSTSEYQSQVDRAYRKVIYDFLKESEKQWKDKFTSYIVQALSQDKDIHIMAHTNGTVKEIDGSISKLRFLNIVFWDLVDIIVQSRPRQVTNEKFGGFMVGLNLFYRNDADQKNHKDNLKISYEASDSGTLISVDRIPIVTLTAVGREPVVKASGRLDLGRDIKPADVEFYKKQIEEQERAASTVDEKPSKTESEDISSSDVDPNETISETEEPPREQNNAKRDETPSYDAPTQVNSGSPVLASEAGKNNICR